MYIYCIYVRKTCICTYICICMKEALGIRFDKGWTTLIACRESERLLPFWIWSMPFTFQTSAREQTWNDWEALQVKLLSFFQNLLKLAMKEKHFHTEFCVCQAKKSMKGMKCWIHTSQTWCTFKSALYSVAIFSSIISLALPFLLLTWNKYNCPAVQRGGEEQNTPKYSHRNNWTCLWEEETDTLSRHLKVKSMLFSFFASHTSNLTDQ